MELKPDRKENNAAESNLSEAVVSTPRQVPESGAVSLNETAVPLAFDELSPHVRIVKPSRPSLTYDRIE